MNFIQAYKSLFLINEVNKLELQIKVLPMLLEFISILIKHDKILCW